ncbi:MAG: metallophosphoesterase [Mucilaginibacter polytrichastri]|nr:metallophosphoesterase [Mucilaginibacter polytrichastri]
MEKELLLIGDTGNVKRTGTDPVLDMMRKHLPGENGLLAFLGDNIYPKGLPPEGHLLRRDAENVLKQHAKALQHYHGRMVFLSGNHDWNKGRRNGYEYVLRQQEYIEKLFGKKNIYLPGNGCPGPELIDFDEKLAVIIINTQWWLQGGLRPIGKQFGCTAGSETDFFIRLEQMITANRGRKVLVLGHSPIYSYSIHGGKYLFKHHLFPLTMYKKNAWLPLPFIGSLLPLYRKYIGAKEDIAHPRYRQLRKRLKEIFRKHPDLIYACGHEHNLQHISKYGNHFLVTGAGSKTTYVRKSGKHLYFGTKQHGFVKLRMNDNGKITLSIWVCDKNEGEKEAYSASL